MAEIASLVPFASFGSSGTGLRSRNGGKQLMTSAHSVHSEQGLHTIIDGRKTMTEQSSELIVPSRKHIEKND